MRQLARNGRAVIFRMALVHDITKNKEENQSPSGSFHETPDCETVNIIIRAAATEIPAADQVGQSDTVGTLLQAIF